MNKKEIKHEMFSPARIAVMREVKNHPKLVQDLAALGQGAEWADQVGEIAAYCNVMLDGMYMPAELDTLCEQLIFKLFNKNVVKVREH